MASPADDQAQAQADIERVASAFADVYFDAAMRTSRHPLGTRPAVAWSEISHAHRDLLRATFAQLLHADVIRVGKRPPSPRVPMPGEEELPLC